MLIRATLLFMLAVVPAQSAVEQNVLREVRLMMQEQKRITFSDLHNSGRFGQEEKAFLGRLYEVFFAIPGFLKSEYQNTGLIPTRSQLARGFGLTEESIELLLRVTETDSRMPVLFQREAGGEIVQLNLDQMDAFLRTRSEQVRMVQWEGQALPEFRLTTFDGQQVSSADLKGKNALIYFWFSGCPPCVRIAPILVNLDERFSGPDFQIIGLNADRLLDLEVSEKSRTQYLSERGIRFLNAHLDEAARRAFGGVNVYPTLFLINDQGVVIRHFLNFQSRDTLEEAIRAAVQSAPES